jgi:Fur family ferric uptake transcriptional regulator
MSSQGNSLYDLMVAGCREHGIRITTKLKLILRHLVQEKNPVSWPSLCATPSVRQACDAATVFRILTKLEKINLVRRIHLNTRQAYYVLARSEQSWDFLVCRACGDVRAVPAVVERQDIAHRLINKFHFEPSFYEMEVYGTCSSCRKIS